MVHFLSKLYVVVVQGLTPDRNFIHRKTILMAHDAYTGVLYVSVESGGHGDRCQSL